MFSSILGVLAPLRPSHSSGEGFLLAEGGGLRWYVFPKRLEIFRNDGKYMTFALLQFKNNYSPVWVTSNSHTLWNVKQFPRAQAKKYALSGCLCVISLVFGSAFGGPFCAVSDCAVHSFKSIRKYLVAALQQTSWSKPPIQNVCVF